MSHSPFVSSGLSAATRRLDWFRRCPSSLLADERHTEWTHFVVLADDVQVLLNLSLVSTGDGSRPAVRLLLAVHSTTWEAGVVDFQPRQVDLRAGRFDVVLGDNALTMHPDGYRISARLPDRPVRVELRLTPELPPLLATNAALGKGTLSWMAVPRLRASGTVRCGDRTFALDGAPAYHDRNWGTFDWSTDFGWDWGFSLGSAAAPWALMYYRITDRSRHRVFQQGVWLWRQGELVRGFRDGQIAFQSRGFVRRPDPTTVPAALASLAPDATGVPEQLEWVASDGEDSLRGVFRSGAPLRIIAPNPEGSTVVHEVPGRLYVSGRLGPRMVTLEGSGLLEVANG